MTSNSFCNGFLFRLFPIPQALQCPLFLLASVTFILLSSDLTRAQQEMKWGEVPRADLEMTKFEADTNATTVILGDVGEVEFRDDFVLSFRRHRRIKILTDAGYDWGNFEIEYNARDNQQRVEGVEGQTLNLNPDGSVKLDKLDKSAIFNEDVDGEHRRIRLAMPALKPGSVIEYRYRIISKRAAFLRAWDFQASEPTRWSDFRAKIPGVLQYAIMRQNVPESAIHEPEPLFWPSNLGGELDGRRLGLKVMSHRWTMTDIPALRPEPYITTIDDYLAKLRFQLAKIVWPGMPQTVVMNSWEELAKTLHESDKFGKQIERHKILREQTENVIAGLEDPELKMNAIHAYVRNTLKWDGDHDVFASRDLDKVFQARSGSSAEIQLILISMLRAAGLEVLPVLISTRDNGRPTDIYSIITQFNHVLAFVDIDGKLFLLDATDPFCHPGILPADDLNEWGWVVDKEKPDWVKIATTSQFVNQTVVSATLASDGLVAGRLESIDDGYSALADRHSLSDKKDEDFIRESWFSNHTDAQIDSFTISDRDSIDKPLMTKAYFSSNGYAQVAGDNIYLNPIFCGRMEANPFKQPNRTFPVDYAYPMKFVYRLYLKLPEGYTVQEAPSNAQMELAGNAAIFRKQAQVSGNMLQLKTEMMIRNAWFPPEDYQALREFYGRIVSAHAEQIVLKRLQ